MGLLMTGAIMLLVIGLVILFGVPLFQMLGKKLPGSERKWTDPAFREKNDTLR